MHKRSIIDQKIIGRIRDAFVRRLRPAWIRKNTDLWFSDYQRFAPIGWINLPPGQRLCVIAPHPDDESIGCGGLIAHWAKTGRAADIIFLTAGENGNRALRDPSLTEQMRTKLQNETAATRKSEADTALSILGAKGIWFDGTDGMLTRDETRLSEQLAVLWTKTQPDLIAAPFPADRHRDHATAARIIAAAAHQILPDETPVLAYEIWSPAPANTLLDISETADIKWQAINAYHSQTATTDYVTATQGLNTYRAISGGSAVPFAEGFYKTDIRQYSDMAKGLKV